MLRLTQAIYAGLFVNEVLPMKLGELARALLVSRWMSVRLGSVAASILVERLFDGVWLATGVVLATLFVPLPHNIVVAGDVFGTVILIALVLLALLAVVGRRVSPDSSGHAESGADEEIELACSTSGRRQAATLGRRLSNGRDLRPFVAVDRLSCESSGIRARLWAFALSLAPLLCRGSLSGW